MIALGVQRPCLTRKATAEAIAPSPRHGPLKDVAKQTAVKRMPLMMDTVPPIAAEGKGTQRQSGYEPALRCIGCGVISCCMSYVANLFDRIIACFKLSVLSRRLAPFRPPSRGHA
mmetsp:Transcript_142989/g.356334  ORF Transcript_142989/g.356334 Transcript_142989/m.356334 type:complete len:115 (+) Transcript_142989:842-1186(+)